MGNKLGEWITLQGENYSSGLAGEQYSVGREVLCWDVDGNFVEDIPRPSLVQLNRT